ncbi:hypothetical protein [Alienimonas californiensis]|uniref:Uncharacterized protein n=1 Tax=Alienimonas californiensis TaxID=2527989 RepID=A0A517P9Z7_9PLAN|nr:hypothetical protein [Alienimonas californiensis]QDT16200.1 hypothetical protein CA12_23000 [Alienimonas californiensis]
MEATLRGGVADRDANAEIEAGCRIAGDDLHTALELLLRQDVRTMADPHILNRGGRGGVSPSDFALSESAPAQENA